MSKSGKKILLITIILSLIGLWQVYSSSRVWSMYLENDQYYYFKRQAIFMVIGYLAMFVLYKIDLDRIFKINKKLLLISFLSLILVLIPGLSIVRNGSRSWFGIGSFAFQPSEFAKFSLIVFTSVFLSNRYRISNSFLKTTLIILIVGGAFFALIMLQPDLGSGLVIIATLIVMTFVSRSKIKHYILLATIAVICFALLISKINF